jgi:WD40-like Beta Propeller Repeat
MSQHLHEPGDDTERLLAEALHARTADVFGRHDSLADLRRAYHRKNSRQTLRFPRMPRLSSAIGIIATAAAVLLMVVGVNWIGHSYNPATTPTHPSHTSAPLKNTGFGYSPADYYPAVNSDGQPVIVGVSDGRQMRILPRGSVSIGRWAPISPMVLSPDGNRVYGVGRQLQDDGKPEPDGVGADHVVYTDLRTNQFTSLATRAERITGMTLSADGTTFAYSLRGSQDGEPDRDVIYVHDLVHDTDRHFLLAAGQRAVIMALSPDGSKLAIKVTGDSPAVQVMSTTSGLIQPPQELLGAAGCQRSSFGPLQWTPSGLYAVRYCGFTTRRIETIVRLSDDPHQPATVLATTSPGLSTALLVCDSPTGLVFFTDQSQGSGHVVTRLATNGQKPIPVGDIRLSGPGT